MVKYCAEHDKLLGVCHTQKVVSHAKMHQSAQENLASNQATYKPCDIFSAGRCEIKEELEDGRMLIRLHLEARYRLVQEVQTLPFSIYDCDVVEDFAEVDLQLLEQAKEKLLTRLIAITATMPDVYDVLNSEKWQQKSALDFSFEIFGLLRLEGHILQVLLEVRDPLQRIEKALSLLNQ